MWLRTVRRLKYTYIYSLKSSVRGEKIIFVNDEIINSHQNFEKYLLENKNLLVHTFIIKTKFS